MFCHTLALALGMTVREVQERVSPDELKWWMAYNSISPIGPERSDYNAALIASSIINCHSTKKSFSIEDVRLKWQGVKSKTRGNVKAMIDILKSIPSAKVTEWQS